MLLLLLLSFSFAFPTSASTDQPQRRVRSVAPRLSRIQKRESVVAGSYVVLVQRYSDVKDILADYGLQALEIYRHVLTGFAADDLSQATVDELLLDPRVKLVAEDGVLDDEQQDGETEPPVQIQSPATWNLDRLDGTGGDFEYHFRYNGTGVHVYVLDSGVRATHEEFENRVATNCFDGVGPCNTDTNGHGSHVGS